VPHDGWLSSRFGVQPASLSEEASSNLGGKGKEEVLPAWLVHTKEIGTGIGSFSVALPIVPQLLMRSLSSTVATPIADHTASRSRWSKGRNPS
jgi:hypothetical protein